MGADRLAVAPTWLAISSAVICIFKRQSLAQVDHGRQGPLLGISIKITKWVTALRTRLSH